MKGLSLDAVIPVINRIHQCTSYQKSTRRHFPPEDMRIRRKCSDWLAEGMFNIVHNSILSWTMWIWDPLQIGSRLWFSFRMEIDYLYFKNQFSSHWNQLDYASILTRVSWARKKGNNYALLCCTPPTTELQFIDFD